MKSIDVVAAVIERDGKFFATQRGYGEYKDWWEFPGGKIEIGESREQALVREIREELNTDIKVGSLLKTIEYDYPEFHLTLHCYLCEVVSGNLELLEHESARWLPASRLDTVKWLPADKDIINLIKETYA